VKTNVDKANLDYNLIAPGVPKLLVSLDTGHMGTYGAPNAGKFGSAAVSYLEWQFRGNQTGKARFLDPNSPNSLVKAKWNVTFEGAWS
jgi:hypothetical protein